jgi:hypothetical protein
VKIDSLVQGRCVLIGRPGIAMNEDQSVWTKKIKCSVLAQGLFTSAVATDRQEGDWAKVECSASLRDQFFYERACLRLVATYLAAEENLQLPERFAFGVKYEMLMREFDSSIVKSCDPYLEAYQSHEAGDLSAAAAVAAVFARPRAVAGVFARRCGDADNQSFLKFGYASFVVLQEAQPRMILSYKTKLD